MILLNFLRHSNPFSSLFEAFLFESTLYLDLRSFMHLLYILKIKRCFSGPCTYQEVLAQVTYSSLSSFCAFFRNHNRYSDLMLVYPLRED